MSLLQLKGAEKTRIECARRLFQKMSHEKQIYDVVDSYDTLMKIINS